MPRKDHICAGSMMPPGRAPVNFAHVWGRKKKRRLFSLNDCDHRITPKRLHTLFKPYSSGPGQKLIQGSKGIDQ